MRSKGEIDHPASLSLSALAGQAGASGFTRQPSRGEENSSSELVACRTYHRVATGRAEVGDAGAEGHSGAREQGDRAALRGAEELGDTGEV